MITQSSITYITKMLQEPHLMTDADREHVRAIAEAYPYFVPARYIEAAYEHKAQPYAPAIMSSMQLYAGNWLLFWEYMQKAIGEEAASEAFREKFIDNKYTAEPIADKEAQIPAIETLILDETEDIEHIHEQVAFTDTTSYTIDSNSEQEQVTAETDETLILPIYTEDYFLHQGIQVSNDIPDEVERLNQFEGEPKSLMVVMSFSEWLMHFKTHSERAKEEQEDQKALKSMWQKEKLAAALEEENEEIPENVFEMAINSITNEEDLVSESLADIYIKQGKYDRAIDMYRKLSLRNPQKNAYFARKIEAIQKGKQS